MTMAGRRWLVPPVQGLLLCILALHIRLQDSLAPAEHNTVANSTVVAAKNSLLVAAATKKTLVTTKDASAVTATKDAAAVTATKGATAVTATKDASAVTATKDASAVTATKDASAVTATKDATAVTATKGATVVTATKGATAVTATKDATAVTATKDASAVTATKDASTVTATKDGAVVTATKDASTVTATKGATAVTATKVAAAVTATKDASMVTATKDGAVVTATKVASVVTATKNALVMATASTTLVASTNTSVVATGNASVATNTSVDGAQEKMLTCQSFQCSGERCYQDEAHSNRTVTCHNETYCELYRFSSTNYTARCSSRCGVGLCRANGSQSRQQCALECCATPLCLQLNASTYGDLPPTTAPSTTATTTHRPPPQNGKVCTAFSCHGDGCFKGRKTITRCILGQDFCEMKKTGLNYMAGCGKTCKAAKPVCASGTKAACYQECCPANLKASCLKLDGKIHVSSAGQVTLAPVLKVMACGVVLLLNYKAFTSLRG